MLGVSKAIFMLSIKSIPLILGIFIVQALFHKLSKRIRIMLWLLMAIRLLCPISYDFVIEQTQESADNEEIFQPMKILENYLTQDAVGYGTETRKPLNFIGKKGGLFGYVQQIKNMDMEAVFACVWLIGMVGMLLYIILLHRKVNKQLRLSVQEEGNVWICDDINSAFVWGLRRPRIYICSAIDPVRREYVLAHEKAHLKRKDYIWKPFGYLLLCIHWFNPFCWIAYWRFCKDVEMACDETVVEHQNDDYRIRYAKVLRDLSSSKNTDMYGPMALWSNETVERIKHITKWKEAPSYVSVFFGVVLGIMSIFTMTEVRLQYADEGQCSEEQVMQNILLLFNSDDAGCDDEGEENLYSIASKQPLKDLVSGQCFYTLYELYPSGYAIVVNETGLIIRNGKHDLAGVCYMNPDSSYYFATMGMILCDTGDEWINVETNRMYNTTQMQYWLEMERNNLAQ